MKRLSPSYPLRGTLQEGRPDDLSRVPPYPYIVAMVDRADGTVWYLTHLRAENRFVLTDVPPPKKGLQAQIVRFGSRDGPYIPLPGGVSARLLVRGGRLGYEVVSSVHSNPAPATRDKWARYSLRLRVPSVWPAYHRTLGYDVLETA